ncbi:hypothetical protein [Clostridium tertium]|jgi:hypothetical protein
MIKAKNINKIKKEYEKYKKLLENESDFIKRLKYERLIREFEYKLMDIDLQLCNIEISLYKNSKLHKNVFVDRHINNVPIERLVDKYGVSRSTLYRILGSATEAFESKKYF